MCYSCGYVHGSHRLAPCTLSRAGECLVSDNPENPLLCCLCPFSLFPPSQGRLMAWHVQGRSAPSIREEFSCNVVVGQVHCVFVEVWPRKEKDLPLALREYREW